MPWQETSPMDLRSQFVREFASGSFTMTELAEAYRIAPKTGYKWVNRHAKGGVLALADRSRRPHGCPHATPANVTQALVAGRQQHPTWGAPKLIAWLRRRDPTTVWPASSTACALLQQAGLVRARRARRPRVAREPRLSVPVAPNDLWTVDYKGEFRTGDAVWCYPLTLRDGMSRYVLRIDALTAPTYRDTRRRFTRAFAKYARWASAVTTEPPSRAPASRGCRNSPSGGCNWGFVRNAFCRAIRNKTGRTSSFTPCSKRKPRGRRRGARRPDNAALAGSGANTTRTDRTRRSITLPPPRTIGPRRACCRHTFFRALTTSATSKSDGSARTAVWRGISACCFSAGPSPATTSGSMKSWMVSGPYRSARSGSRTSMRAPTP